MTLTLAVNELRMSLIDIKITYIFEVNCMHSEQIVYFDI